MSQARNWTAEMQEELVAMAAQGLSTRQIGLALGVSRNSVIARASRTGVSLTFRKWCSPKGATYNITEEERERRAVAFREMRLAGISGSQAGVAPVGHRR